MTRRFFACFGRCASPSSSSSKTGQSPPESASAPAVVSDQAADEQKRGGAVVVELFSSQGCATSPAAEMLASRLGRGDFGLTTPVIVLAYHVDYWDYKGWKDPYGSSQWTVRQKTYVEALGLDTMFTPQLVVQGRAQCVGTDEDALLSSIQSAVRFPSPSFQATFLRPSPDLLQVSLKGALRTKVDDHGVNIVVALYESGLVNDCLAGENRGRVLSNDFVVRRLEKVCTIKDSSANKTVTGSVNFPLWDGFNQSKCGVAVFVQNSSNQMFGSLTFQLPSNL